MSNVLMGQSAGKPIPRCKSNLSNQDASSSEDEVDGARAVPVKKSQKKPKNKQKMPLFRKQSEKAKKRSDHQKWLVTGLFSYMRHGMRFPTMWHFDKFRLSRACAASF